MTKRHEQDPPLAAVVASDERADRLARRSIAGTAFLVLALSSTASAQNAAPAAGAIDLETANRLIDRYTRHVVTQLPRDWRTVAEQRLETEPPRIDVGGVYQITSPAGVLAFEYDGAGRRLYCDALISKVGEDFPRIGLTREEIQEALERAAASGVGTGGGRVFYDEVAHGFFLRRIYLEPPDNDEALFRELDRLTAAGEQWFRRHYLEAVQAHLETLQPPSSATGRDEDFEVTIVLTPDLGYQDLWRGPEPVRPPALLSRSQFTRGQEVWALGLFSGATIDDAGQVKLLAQFSFVYPDGSVYGSPVGKLWWWDAPPDGRLQMSELRAAIELGPDEPPSDYLARIQVCEPTMERCVSAETPFRVGVGEMPGE